MTRVNVPMFLVSMLIFTVVALPSDAGMMKERDPFGE